MSLQLYSHSKQDLEKVVEIILNKAQNFQLYKTAENEAAKEDLISQAEACVFLKISLPTIIHWRKKKIYHITTIMVAFFIHKRNY